MRFWRTRSTLKSLGFTVKTIDRDSLLYTEPGRRLVVSCELQFGDRPLVIHSGFIRNEGYLSDPELITLEKEQIIENIRIWYRTKGCEIDVF